MVTIRPTSRQLRGNFDSLRPSKSHSATQTIDIALGTYGSFKSFGGAVGISHSSWVLATDTFYVYIDKNGVLVLNGTGFPDLSTIIGRVVIASGIILDVIDDRSEVNSPPDAYQVAFDDGSSTLATGDSIQEAIESLDAYVDSLLLRTRTDFINFGFEDGIPNGRVKLTHTSDSPALEFIKSGSGIGRVRYSTSVPGNYASDSNIVIKVFWSPPDSNVGTIRWRLRYRLVSSNLDSVNSALTTVIYDQATSGIADLLTDTESNLVVPAVAINTNDILIFSIEREYTSASDTYGDSALVHLVRVEYTGNVT